MLDVTSYPDISDLFLIADALITDYSSVMFDFSVTGKPIFFFTPDLAHYRDDLRGFYFDLLAGAPGPVLTDPSALVRAIRSPNPAEFAERYAAWQAKYNPRDDGGAGERVVRRMLAEGILDTHSRPTLDPLRRFVSDAPSMKGTTVTKGRGAEQY